MQEPLLQEGSSGSTGRSLSARLTPVGRARSQNATQTHPVAVPTGHFSDSLQQKPSLKMTSSCRGQMELSASFCSIQDAFLGTVQVTAPFGRCRPADPM